MASYQRNDSKDENRDIHDFFDYDYRSGTLDFNETISLAKSNYLRRLYFQPSHSSNLDNFVSIDQDSDNLKDRVSSGKHHILKKFLHISALAYVDTKNKLPICMTPKKNVMRMWIATVLRRIIWKLVFLEIWAVGLRFLLQLLGEREGLRDAGVNQLASGLIFVLGIVLSINISLGLNKFQSTMDKFRIDVLGSLCNYSSKLCANVSGQLNPRNYAGFPVSFPIHIMHDGNVKHTPDIMAREIQKYNKVKNTIDFLLFDIGFICECLPYRMYAALAPGSAIFLKTEIDYHTRYTESRMKKTYKHFNSHSFGGIDKIPWNLKTNSEESQYTERTWEDEIFTLRILTECIEKQLSLAGGSIPLYPCMIDLDSISTNMTRIISLLEAKAPDPFINMMYIFVHIYLLLIPLYFSISYWWIDMIMYAMIGYVILGTYSMAEQLRTENGFENNHTYVPFIEWLNTTTHELSGYFKIAENHLK